MSSSKLLQQMKQDKNLKKPIQRGLLSGFSNYPFHSSEGVADQYRSNLDDFKEDYNPTLPENLITKSSTDNIQEFQNVENSIFFDEVSDPQEQEPITSQGYLNQQTHLNQTDIQQTGESLFDLALPLFRKKLLNNEIYIEACHLIEIFIEIFEVLKIHVNHEDIHQLINSISDFIPKKIIEQGFIDLFNFPQVMNFFLKYHIIEDSETARFTGTQLHNIGETEEIPDPNISLESLSFVCFFMIFEMIYF